VGKLGRFRCDFGFKRRRSWDLGGFKKRSKGLAGEIDGGCEAKGGGWLAGMEKLTKARGMTSF